MTTTSSLGNDKISLSPVYLATLMVPVQEFVLCDTKYRLTKQRVGTGTLSRRVKVVAATTHSYNEFSIALAYQSIG